jgi:phage shock protein A
MPRLTLPRNLVLARYSPTEAPRRTPLLAKALLGLALLGAPGLSGCQSLYFGAMEQLGAHARDLLVQRVVEAKESQAEAQEQFQTALEAFQSATSFQGGELEAYYKKIKAEYENSVERSKGVEQRIDKVEEASKRLFSEWQDEINEFSDQSYKAQSAKMRDDAQKRYNELIGKMRAAEEKMDPVLTKFKDRVLFIKSNLNYAAINSLEGDLALIEDDVGSLIKDMQASIAEADEFIAAMQPVAPAG